MNMVDFVGLCFYEIHTELELLNLCSMFEALGRAGRNVSLFFHCLSQGKMTFSWSLLVR